MILELALTGNYGFESSLSNLHVCFLPFTILCYLFTPICAGRVYKLIVKRIKYHAP